MTIEYFSERRAAVKVGVNRLTLRRHRLAGNITPLVVAGVVLYSSNSLRDWSKRFRLPRGKGAAASE